MNKRRNEKKEAGKALRRVLCLLAVTVAAAFPAGAEPFLENGSWYYRNEAGEPVKNAFVKIDGSLYYFGNDGALASEAAVEYGSERYYCDASGKCLTDQWKKCAYAGDETERWHYYLGNGKAFENGWLVIGSEKYHFSNSCMDSGWYVEETDAGKQNVYYLGAEEDGRAAKGWLAWKGADAQGAEEYPVGWYYFSETGKMVCDTEMKIGNNTYAFNGNGTMVVGFCRITGSTGNVRERYYDRRTGSRAEGWHYLSSETEGEEMEGWYCFKEGEAFTAQNGTRKLTEEFGVVQIDNFWYGFDKTGRMLTGLATDGEAWYCFGNDGKMVTGYVNVLPYDADAPAERMLFSTEGTAPPALGASVTGVSDGFLYYRGCRMCAGEEGYEQIEIKNGEISHSYVVNANGAVIRSGVVTLKNGLKKKIVREEDGWKLLEIE